MLSFTGGLGSGNNGSDGRMFHIKAKTVWRCTEKLMIIIKVAYKWGLEGDVLMLTQLHIDGI